MSVNYVKKVYFPVGVLEHISRNLLKIAVKKFNLSIKLILIKSSQTQEILLAAFPKDLY